MGSILDDKTKCLKMGGVDLHNKTVENEQKLQKRLLDGANLTLDVANIAVTVILR